MSAADCIARVEQIVTTISSVSASSLAGTSTTRSVTGASTTAFADALSTAAATEPQTPSTDTATGSEIVTQAKEYLGVPYAYGGEDKTGMDCSGLVQRVLEDLGYDNVPRTASQQQHLGEEVAALADAEPGDLLVTKNADHIVIYAGNGKIVHAPYAGRDVSFQDNYLTDADIQTIRRVSEPAQTSDLPAATGSVSPDAGMAAAIEQLTAVLSGRSISTVNTVSATSQYSSIASLLEMAQ